jgi:predicted Zn-dependent protease
MVYGENPRDGFFREALFLHPDLEFQFQFPAGWTTANQSQAVLAQSPNQDAMIQLQVAEASSALAGLQTFIGQEGITGGQIQQSVVNGLPSASADFAAQSEQTALRGRVTFIEYGGIVYRALGFSVEAQWASYQETVSATLRSFAQLTDQTALAVQPMRISIVTMDRSMTLRQFNERYPSTVPLEELAMVNQAEPYTAYAEGDLVKRIVGGVNQ